MKKYIKEEWEMMELKGYFVMVAAITLWFAFTSQGEPTYDDKFCYVFIVGGLTLWCLVGWLEGAMKRRSERIFNKEWDKRNK